MILGAAVSSPTKASGRSCWDKSPAVRWAGTRIFTNWNCAARGISEGFTPGMCSNWWGAPAWPRPMATRWTCLSMSGFTSAAFTICGGTDIAASARANRGSTSRSAATPIGAARPSTASPSSSNRARRVPASVSGSLCSTTSATFKPSPINTTLATIPTIGASAYASTCPSAHCAWTTASPFITTSSAAARAASSSASAIGGSSEMKIPNSKFQIQKKPQIPSSKTSLDDGPHRSRDLDFGTFLGFGIWDLGFRLLPCALCCTSFLIALSLTASPQTSLLSALPLYFEAGAGIENQPDHFLARGWGGVLDLCATSATATLVKADSSGPRIHDQATERIRHRTVRSRTVHWQWVGANAQARISGVGELPGKVNYLLGNDPGHWRQGVPIFGKVRIESLYPGVDLVCYGNQQQVEYDFVVGPGADPGAISFRVSGADELSIDAQGDLILDLGDGQLRQLKPRVYQMMGGAQKEIAGGYRLRDKETVGFEVGNYDREVPLVLDPVLSYSTFLGGAGHEIGRSIALDSSANIYVAGETLSANLPVSTNAFQKQFAGGFPGAGGDAFVAKFDNLGSNLFYLTYLGGKGDDAALGVAVDGTGNAYLTGVTDSTNFPTINAIKNHISGAPEIYLGLYPFDAFVAKLNTNGSALIYSTYLGGDAEDQGVSIAVDANNNAYVGVHGNTDSLVFHISAQVGGI